MKHLFTSILFALGLLAQMPVHATLNNLNTAPLGTHGTSGVAYGYWDSFAGTSFTGVTATLDDSSTASNFASSSLSLTGTGSAGFGPYPSAGGDAFYDSTGTTAFTIAAQTDFAPENITLQIKLTSPADASAITAYYSPLLNGTLAPTSVSASAATAETVFGQSIYVVSYTWSSLSLAANTPFNITFGRDTGAHVATDTIALDVSSNPVPAPEPVAAALLSAGVLAFAFRRQARGYRIS